MSFLKAEWRKLAIANYEIDSSLLKEFIPYGTELDFYHNKCYVSLVGFRFLNTKLLGLKIPFHINFEEVNLRFYVKRLENNEWKRGVVFIKEIVPKPAITMVANTIYHENYETLPMRHIWKESDHEYIVEYSWRKNSRWQTFRVRAGSKAEKIKQASKTEFITEHYWGYAKVSNLKTNEYEVTHPRWYAYEVKDYLIDVNFEHVYGAQFGFLSKQSPVSVMLAEGSEVSVEYKKKIEKRPATTPVAV
jgi:uncharacterized protein YqjF (DUF2071 family)